MGSEGDCQVMDDSIYDLIVGYEGDYLHLTATCGTATQDTTHYIGAIYWNNDVRYSLEADVMGLP